MQAALGLVQLQRLDEMIVRRRQLAIRYSEALANISWMLPPVEPVGYRHNFQSYMVRLTNGAPMTRDQLMQELLNRGISSRRGIMASHRELPYAEERWTKELKESEAVTDNCIILPLYHTMTEEDQDYVIESIREINAA